MINLEKIKPTIATAILLCCSNIFIVALSIFLLNRHLFFQLNLWQMLAITVGLSFPFLLVQWIVLTLAGDLGQGDAIEVKKWALSGMATAILLASLLPFSMHFKDGLTTHYSWVAGIQIMAGTGAYVSLNLKKKPNVPIEKKEQKR